MNSLNPLISGFKKENLSEKDIWCEIWFQISKLIHKKGDLHM